MRRPLIRERTGQTDAATAVIIPFEPVKPGEFWVVRGIFYANSSGESVTFTGGIVNQGEFHSAQYADSVADGAGDGVLVHYTLREGEQFAFQVKGAANKGEVWLRISGEIYNDEPEIVVVAQAKPPAGA